MTVPSSRHAAFRQFTLFVLVCTLAVILWGAYVRATGSGAGCGSHWPMCNGEIIPRVGKAATLIEFTHRITSGLAFFLVVGQLVWARRLFPRSHGARRSAAAALFFMITEAGIGAGLVLFEMVAENRSMARGAWMVAHLVNTFALIASIALAGWLATPPSTASPATNRRRSFALPLACAMAGTLLVATSGAIAALGDTLFPARSLAEGWQQDLSPAAHLFVRLRVWHPLLAVAVAIYLLVLAALLVSRHPRRSTRSLAAALAGLVLVQLGAGLLNLVLLAPLAMQLVHLLLADLIWIALVAITAHLLTGMPAANAVARSAQPTSRAASAIPS